MRYTRITDKQVERATKLLADGHSWRAIAAEVGASHDGIRRRVDPKYRAMKNEASNKANRRYSSTYYGSTGVSANVHSKRPPEEVIAECAMAHARRRSLTAEVLGDPLPGRSALDKMRAAQTSADDATLPRCQSHGDGSSPIHSDLRPLSRLSTGNSNTP